MKKRTKTIVMLTGFLAAVIGLIALANTKPTETLIDGKVTAATVYKSPSCGCCGVYVLYLKRSGVEVKVENKNDLTAIKEQFNIPPYMQSCHTTVIGDYFIEGHVPTEAIEKLLTEKPEVKGIAMPGMPAGSPGMPGAKIGTFDIQALTKNGTWETFMSL